MDRRSFLAGALGGIGYSLYPGLARATKLESTANKRLIVVFLRGAVDGLNVVIPYSDPAYRDLRPSIAISPPGRDGGGGALDLDGQFGLHPALAALMPLWQQKSLAFIHAAGSTDPTRSHFDAQLNMETGTPGRVSTLDGWMNRLLGSLPGPQAVNAGLSIGETLPRIMAGRIPVATLGLGRDLGRPNILDRPAIASAFDQLYAGSDPISQSYHQARESHQELMATLNRGDGMDEMTAANNGAPDANSLPASATRLARLMQRDPHCRLAFLALGGWDTHIRQGAAQGQLANRLKPLGDGLAALVQGLGPAFADTVIVVMSEFGRTAHENGNGGTDHGHGNVMWVLGGPVQGGKVYGQWPGLSADRLYQARDLAVTTDFRQVLAGVIGPHWRLDDAALRQIFPQMPENPTKLPGLLSS